MSWCKDELSWVLKRLRRTRQGLASAYHLISTSMHFSPRAGWCWTGFGRYPPTPTPGSLIKIQLCRHDADRRNWEVGAHTPEDYILNKIPDDSSWQLGLRLPAVCLFQLLFYACYFFHLTFLHLANSDPRMAGEPRTWGGAVSNLPHWLPHHPGHMGSPCSPLP